MCVFVIAQGHGLFVYVCIFPTYRWRAMCVLSCQWLPLTYTQEDKHTPDCLHLCVQGRCVCTCIRLRAFVLMFPQDKQCHPILLWIYWANWHWLNAAHTFTDKTYTKVCLWINLHMQDNMSESEFLGQDGYTWPQSLHVECSVGRRGADTNCTVNTWAVKQVEQFAGVTQMQ